MLFRKKKKNPPSETPVEATKNMDRTLFAGFKAEDYQGFPDYVSEAMKIIQGQGPEQVAGPDDIYWRLMAAGTGDEIARAVTSNQKYLCKYLAMKEKNYPDLKIAAYFVDFFNH